MLHRKINQQNILQKFTARIIKVDHFFDPLINHFNFLAMPKEGRQVFGSYIFHVEIELQNNGASVFILFFGLL